MIKDEGGQSLVDILIGLALITLSISFTLILVYGGQSISIDRENYGTAKSLAREALEASGLIVKSNWENLADGNYGLILSPTTSEWSFSSGTENIGGFYSRKVTLTTLSNNEKSVSSTVTWQAAPNRPLTVQLVTLLTNWRGIESTGGDTGGGNPTGDWKNPRTLGSVDLGPGNSATDLDVKTKIVYMSAEASSVSKPDFFIIDATDGENPVLKSELNVGSRGLNSVDVAGNYAYVANKSSLRPFVIIDISNMNSPFVATSSSIPGISENDTYGQTIFYYDSKVYIGTNEDSGGAEFHVFNVSNPLSPTYLGSFEINDDVNDIFISDNKAYLATDLSGAGLKILDISNSASITSLGQSYSVDTNSVYSMDDSLALLGPAQSLYVVNVSNPSSISTLGTYNAGDFVYDIATRGSLAFIGTSNSNTEFQVIDISTTTAPVLYSSFNFPQVASGIDYEDNLVYVAVRSNDALRIITSTP